MQIYIAATPAVSREAASYGRELAHIAYLIGPGSILLRQNLPLQTKGGLLAVCDRDSSIVDDPQSLCQAVLRECSRRSYAGVLLDFEGPVRRDLAAFANLLAPLLSGRRRTLYVPEPYAGEKRMVLINSAVSGGSFREYLRESAARYGGRVALDVQRLRMDFTIPARTGEGAPLSGDAFCELIDKRAPSTFFSQELCVRYFTYANEEEAHFVLFDDAATLLQKIRVAAELGYRAALFQWPEICDLAPSLFRA